VSYHFYNGGVMVRFILSCFLVTVLTPDARAQTPQPFPKAGTAQPQKSATTPPPAAPATQAPAAPVDPNAPPGPALGVTVYPGAQFLGSYDAGRGQRYYLFGATASFAELVGYYRTQTGERGDLVFKDPQTHMFTGGTLARYREETMAFPPSVTVKDWTSGGSAGYPNPRIGAQPQRFPTVIMIVPPPAGTPAAR
jgi:hypothetical protein